MDIFIDKGLYLSDFSDKILVHCPKCNEKAEVNTEECQIFCSSCGYFDKKQIIYYSLHVSRNCPQCGKEIAASIKNVAKKKDSIRLSCKNCSFVGDYKPEYDQDYPCHYREGQDGVFGAELWLKKMYKRHIFWANNYKHLKYLKDFIGAKIRATGYTDADLRNNNTMASRLPKFIKSSKNRNDLLKIIEKLESK